MADQQPPLSGSDPLSDPLRSSTADHETLDAVVADGGVIPSVAAAEVAETPQADSSVPAATTHADSVADAMQDQTAIDELLSRASFDDAAAVVQQDPPPDTVPLDLPNFQQVMRDAQVSSIDLLRDVELNVKIELGRSRMLVEDVLKLGEGSVVELDKLAGDPVDLFVNDRLVARGEVLVLNDNFCVRVAELIVGESACA
jgi:flagellar motor switch protein FliN